MSSALFSITRGQHMPLFISPPDDDNSANISGISRRFIHLLVHISSTFSPKNRHKDEYDSHDQYADTGEHVVAEAYIAKLYTASEEETHFTSTFLILRNWTSLLLLLFKIWWKSHHGNFSCVGQAGSGRLVPEFCEDLSYIHPEPMPVNLGVALDLQLPSS